MQRPGILSVEQLQGVKLFGARSVVRDGVRVSEPAHGLKAVRALLRVGYIQDDDAMMRLLKDAGVNGPGIELFRKQKVVVRRPPAEGGGLEVQPLIPGLTDDNLSTYAASDPGIEEYTRPIVDDRALKYRLNAIFTDTTISDKLQLSPLRLQTAKRLAVSDPAAAAASLGDYLRNNGFPNASVVAGDYAKTTRRAREAIRQYADTIVYKDTAAPAVVGPAQLRMSFDEFLPGGEPVWTVIGPLKFGTEVQAVYQLAVKYGPERVMFMLGVETAMLQINILSHLTNEYYTGVVHGYSSLAGIQPQGTGFPSELTAEQQSRLMGASQKISPVYVDGVVVGTAVQVTDRHLILNEHTLTDTADAGRVSEVCGQPVIDSRSVAHDICMIRREGITAQWVFRQADIGERVVLCFSVGGTVEYSEVLKVDGIYGKQLVLTESNVLRKGASGAAVVSLRDSALLGIFSTKRGPKVVCTAFSSADFSIVSDYQSVASSECAPTPGIDAGNRTYERMVKKGLLGFLEGISNSCASLYYQQSQVRYYAGLVTNHGGKWVTTVDPNVAQLVMEDGKPLACHSERVNLYSVEGPPPVLSQLPNVRTVNPGERVFLFTKTGDDVAMSSVRVVTHCMADMMQFFVEDFGDSEEVMTGGLIVAEKDAAVLGQFVRKDMDSFGASIVSCVSLLPVRGGGVAGLKEPTLDVRSVMSDLEQWVVKTGPEARELANYGKLVVDVVAGQRAYHRGMSITMGTVTLRTEWHERRVRTLSALGWTPEDHSAFAKYDSALVANAFLAMLYLRDPVGTTARLGTLLSQDTVIDYTPITAEFPFPRPTSATGSVSSTHTRKASDPTQSDLRLKELETKLDTLSSMVFEGRVSK